MILIDVLRYERNSAVLSKYHINNNMQNKTTVNFMVERVNHNFCALNAENTFHKIEMIASTTDRNFARRKVKKSIVLEKKALSISSADITPYEETTLQETNIDLQPIHSSVL